MSNRIEIRKTINNVGKDFFDSLDNNLYLRSLQNLTGEIMGLNEEYVLNHQGEDETFATLSILRTGFMVNQKAWLSDIREMLIKCQNKEGVKKC